MPSSSRLAAILAYRRRHPSQGGMLIRSSAFSSRVPARILEVCPGTIPWRRPGPDHACPWPAAQPPPTRSPSSVAPPSSIRKDSR